MSGGVGGCRGLNPRHPTRSGVVALVSAPAGVPVVDLVKRPKPSSGVCKDPTTKPPVSRLDLPESGPDHLDHASVVTALEAQAGGFLHMISSNVAPVEDVVVL